MTTFARAENGDLIIENGQIKMVDGLEAYRVVLQAAVLTLVGELQLDTEYGIPHIDSVLGCQITEAYWHSQMEQTIMNFDFVRSIQFVDMNVDYVTKKFSYTINITTDLGDVELRG